MRRANPYAPSTSRSSSLQKANNNGYRSRSTNSYAGPFHSNTKGASVVGLRRPIAAEELAAAAHRKEASSHHLSADEEDTTTTHKNYDANTTAPAVAAEDGAARHRGITLPPLRAPSSAPLPNNTNGGGNNRHAYPYKHTTPLTTNGMGRTAHGNIHKGTSPNSQSARLPAVGHSTPTRDYDGSASARPNLGGGGGGGGGLAAARRLLQRAAVGGQPIEDRAEYMQHDVRPNAIGSPIPPVRKLRDNYLPLLSNPRSGPAAAGLRRGVGGGGRGGPTTNTTNGYRSTSNTSYGRGKAATSYTRGRSTNSNVTYPRGGANRGAVGGRSPARGHATTNGGAAASSYFALPYTEHTDHPLYLELQQLYATRTSLMGKVSVEKSALTSIKQQLKAAETHEGTMVGEVKRLQSRASTLKQQREKIAAVGTAAEAKHTLVDRIATLQILKNDYNGVMAALKQLDKSLGGGVGVGGGGGGGGRSRSTNVRGGAVGIGIGTHNRNSGARSKLQANLDHKRLADEEQMVVKYDQLLAKTSADVDELHRYMGTLREAAAAGAASNSNNADGSMAAMSIGITIPEEAGATTKRTGNNTTTTTSYSRSNSPTRGLLFACNHNKTANDPTNNKTAAPTLCAKAREKLNDYERLKQEYDAEEKRLDTKLRLEEQKACKALDEANDKFIQTQQLSSDNQSQLAALRASLSAKMASAAQKKAEADTNRDKTLLLQKQVAEWEQKVGAVEAALRESAQSLTAAMLVHEAALSNNVRQQQDHEERNKKELSSIMAKIAAETQRLNTAISAKEKVTRLSKANHDKWSQQEANRRRLIDQYEKAKGRQADMRRTVDELKAANTRELQTLTYASQKSGIIAELRQGCDKESIKLADVEKQNAQLEKVLNATVDMLRRNNVEVMF